MKLISTDIYVDKSEEILFLFSILISLLQENYLLEPDSFANFRNQILSLR